MNIKIDSLDHSRIVSLSDLETPVVPHVGDKGPQAQLAGMAICRRICICCGEPMAAGGNSLSRNPNVCASCSSLSDGMEKHAEQPVQNDDWQTGISVPIIYKSGSDARFS
jgi:hypothetical protein